MNPIVNYSVSVALNPAHTRNAFRRRPHGRMFRDCWQRSNATLANQSGHELSALWLVSPISRHVSGRPVSESRSTRALHCPLGREPLRPTLSRCLLLSDAPAAHSRQGPALTLPRMDSLIPELVCLCPRSITGAGRSGQNVSGVRDIHFLKAYHSTEQ